jgi:hypothetical protein
VNSGLWTSVVILGQVYRFVEIPDEQTRLDAWFVYLVVCLCCLFVLFVANRCGLNYHVDFFAGLGLKDWNFF